MIFSHSEQDLKNFSRHLVSFSMYRSFCFIILEDSENKDLLDSWIDDEIICRGRIRSSWMLDMKTFISFEVFSMSSFRPWQAS